MIRRGSVPRKRCGLLRPIVSFCAFALQREQSFFPLQSFFLKLTDIFFVHHLCERFLEESTCTFTFHQGIQNVRESKSTVLANANKSKLNRKSVSQGWLCEAKSNLNNCFDFKCRTSLWYALVQLCVVLNRATKFVHCFELIIALPPVLAHAHNNT